MTAGASLSRIHAPIANRIELNLMVEIATGRAMVMAAASYAAKIGGMAMRALTATVQRRADQGFGCGGMAGQAAIWVMGFAGANKRRGRGRMAADAVCGYRGPFCWWTINRNRCRVTVSMAIKIRRMAGNAGAALAAIDSGIAMVAGPAATVSRVMARGTGVMYRRDSVADMAAHAECGGGHCASMTVLMAAKIRLVTLGASGANVLDAADDVGRMGPRFWLNQRWRVAMAIGATEVVNQQGVVRYMAKRHAGRVVQDDVQSIRRHARVILCDMTQRCRLVAMTV